MFAKWLEEEDEEVEEEAEEGAANQQNRQTKRQIKQIICQKCFVQMTMIEHTLIHTKPTHTHILVYIYTHLQANYLNQQQTVQNILLNRM